MKVDALGLDDLNWSPIRSEMSRGMSLLNETEECKSSNSSSTAKFEENDKDFLHIGELLSNGSIIPVSANVSSLNIDGLEKSKEFSHSVISSMIFTDSVQKPAGKPQKCSGIKNILKASQNIMSFEGFYEENIKTKASPPLLSR